MGREGCSLQVLRTILSDAHAGLKRVAAEALRAGLPSPWPETATLQHCARFHVQMRETRVKGYSQCTATLRDSKIMRRIP